ncbi:MAG: hypothetical protein FWH48_06290, partial [Oscillospiraceae bacterium]|nr:hypothetical protein [Oscillospiraceae bacterium]
MKRKILGIILVLSFCTGIFMPVRAADNLTPYILGTTVSDSTEQDIWYSMQIESDGAYKVFHRTIGGYIGVYEKTGKTAFGDLGNKTKIVDYGYNNLENAFIEEYAIYLHKGDYLIQHSRSDQFSFKVEKIATPYGEDKEPNETAAEAIPLAINGKAGGVMGGVNENGDIDVSDFYKIEILGSVKCVFNLISDKDYISFDILTSKGEAFYLPQAQGFVTSSAYNDLLKKFELNLEVDFEEAGTYYIRLGNRYYRPYNPYLLTMGDGSGNSAEPEPIIPPPKDKQILEVDIPSEPEGKLTALVTEVGIKFDITPNASEFGYRIYRSTDPAIEGISISDFPLTKGQFVDVNIDPNTRYYYTIRKVIAEAGFDRATIEIIPEVLGEPSQKIALDSGDIIPLPQPPPGYDYTKNFLLMKIGEPNMLFNEETVEIDAG